jgi:hypothetical protein
MIINLVNLIPKLPLGILITDITRLPVVNPLALERKRWAAASMGQFVGIRLP